MSLASFRCDATAILDPRVRRLADHLQIGTAETLGYLWHLRCWCELMERTDGDLTGLEEEDIEAAACWEGADTAFVRAATAVQLLQPRAGGELWLSLLGAAGQADEPEDVTDAETEASEPLRQRDLVGVAA